jgi:formylglycine-generating enzyme required for sulfatase activity
MPEETRIKPEILRHRREDVSLVSREWSSRIASGIPSGSVLELNKDWVGRDSPTSRFRSNGRGGFGSVGVARKAISPNHPEIGCDSMSTTSGRSTAVQGWQLPPQLGVSVPAGRIMRVTARIVTPQRCRARFSSEAPAWATCSRTNLGPGACEAELRLAAPDAPSGPVQWTLVLEPVGQGEPGAIPIIVEVTEPGFNPLGTDCLAWQAEGWGNLSSSPSERNPSVVTDVIAPPVAAASRRHQGAPAPPTSESVRTQPSPPPQPRPARTDRPNGAPPRSAEAAASSASARAPDQLSSGAVELPGLAREEPPRGPTFLKSPASEPVFEPPSKAKPPSRDAHPHPDPEVLEPEPAASMPRNSAVTVPLPSSAGGDRTQVGSSKENPAHPNLPPPGSRRLQPAPAPSLDEIEVIGEPEVVDPPLRHGGKGPGPRVGHFILIPLGLIPVGLAVLVGLSWTWSKSPGGSQIPPDYTKDGHESKVVGDRFQAPIVDRPPVIVPAVQLPPQWTLNLKDGIMLKMIKVDGGLFEMGADLNDGPDIRNDETPSHRVVLRPYYLSETELPWRVVEAYWRRFPGDRPALVQVPEDMDLPATSLMFKEWTRILNWMSREGGREEYYDAEARPPHDKDARRFGRCLRLPTEAELEFVLRQDPDPSNYLPDLMRVDQAAANRSGFKGLRGNVWEWTGDWFGPYPRSDHSVNDPFGLPDGNRKVIRGGCNNAGPRLARATARAGQDPEERAYNVGVRIATYGGP